MVMMSFHHEIVVVVRNKALVLLLAVVLSIASAEKMAVWLPNGVPNCPCVDSKPILATQSNCLQSDWSTRGILIPGTGNCAPLSYGGDGCAAYDRTHDPACFSPDPSSVADENNHIIIPDYCSAKWCYVDPDKCRQSTKQFYGSDRFQDVYYSYDTCGSSASSWQDYVTLNSWVNRDTPIVVALPFVEYPFHYKLRDPTNHSTLYEIESPEAYSDVIPWHGIVMEYFHAVLGVGGIPSEKVEFVHRSKGSQHRGHASPYTQVVSDVQVGVADMAISTLWVTSQRLAMTSFTIPIAIDEFTLWIPQPKFGTDTLDDSVQKILMPFSTGLWLATLLVILLFTLLSVIVSPEELIREFEDDDDGAPGTFYQKGKRVVTVLTDSLNVSMLEFFGGEVNYSNEVNISQKLLNFSFALFIFITVAAYTANLAAFLTLSGTTDYLSSIEEAASQNVAICAPAGVQDDLQALYPDADWIFSLHPIEMFEAYDNGDCQVFVMGWIETRASPEYQGWICERELVRLHQNPVLEKKIAFPVSAELAAGFSHWIVKAQSLGITYDSFVTQEEAVCHLEITTSNEDDEDAEMQQLTVNNLTLPLAVFGIAFTLALIIYSAKTTRKAMNHKKTRNNNNNRDLATDSSSANEEDESMQESSSALLGKKEQSTTMSKEEMVSVLCARQKSLLRELQEQETLLRQLGSTVDGQEGSS